MQNKPNLVHRRRIANVFITTDYENKSNWTLGENKPNSNPIKPNFQKAQMNVNLTLTKDYRKKDDFLVRINKPNFRNGQNECNLKYNKGLWQFSALRPQKNKPKQTQFRTRCEEQKDAAAAAGLQEMLLQSYSGTIRIFPAIPANWKDVSFKTLRAEGAFLVSAERKGGLTNSVRIISEKGGPCRLENPVLVPKKRPSVNMIDSSKKNYFFKIFCLTKQTSSTI